MVQDSGPEEVRVSFPADRGFGRIGRVAVAGLALRLGFDVAVVERLRLAVDEAVGSLSGTGRITLVARWSPGSLVLDLTNPDAEVGEQERRRLADGVGDWLLDDVEHPSTVRLEIPTSR